MDALSNIYINSVQDMIGRLGSLNDGIREVAMEQLKAFFGQE
jgi:hypothetical protein